MLRIHKKEEPSELRNWKVHFKHSNGREANYEDLSKRENFKIKEQLKKELAEEQHNLCCYCCAELTLKNSHIEHFRPRNKYPQLSLEYNNLHISCNGKDGDSCGHKKEDWFEEGVTLSPLEEDVEEKFVYYRNGKIVEKDDCEKVEENIKRLSLNEERLKIARMQALACSGIEDAESLEELEILLDDLMEMYGGEICPFWNILRYFAEEKRRGMK